MILRSLSPLSFFCYTKEEESEVDSMAEEEDIGAPHGVQQNIKMDLLGMIHSAENPFDIIYEVAKYLEKASSEDGYADIIRDNIRSVYGLALGEKKLLQDELNDVIARGKRIKASYDTGDFTEEEKKRIEFALILHRKNAERLQEMIHKAEIDGTSLYLEK